MQLHTRTHLYAAVLVLNIVQERRAGVPSEARLLPPLAAPTLARGVHLHVRVANEIFLKIFPLRGRHAPQHRARVWVEHLHTFFAPLRLGVHALGRARCVGSRSAPTLRALAQQGRDVELHVRPGAEVVVQIRSLGGGIAFDKLATNKRENCRNGSGIYIERTQTKCNSIAF